MAHSKKFDDFITKFLAGELDADQTVQLRQHAAECSDCAEMIATHHLLLQSGASLETAPEKEFSQMRRDVLSKLDRPKKIKVQQSVSWIPEWFRRPSVAYALSILLLIGGWTAGRLVDSDGRKNFIGEIRKVAAGNTDLRDVQNSPYIYSNISFKKIDEQQVALSFDVTTHLDIVRDPDDPLVKDVLAQSLLNEESVGSRLKAIAWADEVIDPRIKEALIYAMKNDNNAAVRMKAIHSLMRYPDDSEIQNAFIELLKSDTQVTVRLAAIDYLANKKFSPELLRQIQQQPNRAVEFKVKKVLNN